ncbi:ABC-type cobalamin/Fe3+-siderophores transport system [Fructobacillus tropaeoli]|uniref:ABC transporter ATP-binding protein n=1 Tax=Fructobacillus tropaeoli TaxID=709323 RepID=UPI002D950701|nr:ABC-type cobalamin/Fe3+-siderophores transport system [Fructobacillus tropaeoli]
MTILVENLTVKKKTKSILNDVNCRFEDGHLSTIIGVNGSGKSVFLKALLGFEKKDGQVTFEKDHKISYIPQKVTADQYFTVFEFILLGLYGDLDFRVNDDEQLQAIESVMDELGISDLADQQFADLSGGQQQLVVLAQALVRQPTVIIADEPTSALDIKKQLQYLQTLQRYVHRHQIVGIIVIHDLTLAALHQIASI